MGNGGIGEMGIVNDQSSIYERRFEVHRNIEAGAWVEQQLHFAGKGDSSLPGTH